jgi:hypothetical protein
MCDRAINKVDDDSDGLEDGVGESNFVVDQIAVVQLGQHAVQSDLAGMLAVRRNVGVVDIRSADDDVGPRFRNHFLFLKETRHQAYSLDPSDHGVGEHSLAKVKRPRPSHWKAYVYREDQRVRSYRNVDSKRRLVHSGRPVHRRHLRKIEAKKAAEGLVDELMKPILQIGSCAPQRRCGVKRISEQCGI